MLTTTSLFEDEKLAKILLKCIKNNTPKDLEKTKWWNLIICESLCNEDIARFIKHSWPNIVNTDPEFTKGWRGSIPWHKDLLSSFNVYNLNYKDQIDFHKSIENYLVDKKLISIIQEEQLLIKQGKIKGPTPKPVEINTTKGQSKILAVLESYKGNFAYRDICNFLIDLSEDWISNLKKGSLNIDCTNQPTEEKDDEIAEIIFSNFPKTFDCESIKEKHLYICSYNWNFTKEKDSEQGLIVE
jgi:hypothetical protein